MKLKQETLIAWGFLLPALVLLMAFFIIPIIRTTIFSLYTGGINSQFAGLDNYVRLLFEDSKFIRWQIPPSGAMVNTMIWGVVFPIGTVICGMAITVLSDNVLYEKVIKSIVFVPMVISATAASVIFRFVYSNDTNIGVINAVLSQVIEEFQTIPWLGSTRLVNYSLIGAGIWIWTGLAMVIFSAAYKALDRSILEAAKIDGANARQTFFWVILPMLKMPIVFVLITMVINSLKLVDLILVMTAGGPRGSSRTLGFSVYWELVSMGKMHYGSAIAIVMLILFLPFIYFQLKQVRKGTS